MPHFRLVEMGMRASLNVPKESRMPVLVNDVQGLLIYSIVGDKGSYLPYRLMQHEMICYPCTN